MFWIQATQTPLMLPYIMENWISRWFYFPPLDPLSITERPGAERAMLAGSNGWTWAMAGHRSHSADWQEARQWHHMPVPILTANVNNGGELQALWGWGGFSCAPDGQRCLLHDLPFASAHLNSETRSVMLLLSEQGKKLVLFTRLLYLSLFLHFSLQCCPFLFLACSLSLLSFYLSFFLSLLLPSLYQRNIEFAFD